MTDPNMTDKPMSDPPAELDREALAAASRAPVYRKVRRAEAIPGGTPTEKAPDPSLGGDPIAKERYTSTDFMRLEWERMWTKVWLLGVL